MSDELRGRALREHILPVIATKPGKFGAILAELNRRTGLRHSSQGGFKSQMKYLVDKGLVERRKDGEYHLLAAA